ncbi:MAG: tRNA preQ1(34) S-adenosylmethionine ribosyltransferase-isomerase QueA [Deltaproteobacteria bacterium RIFCSPLOWO2_12_FULL_57_22]|nr:MAG: tRNA preQ1(34) S-adenosylmethionine ribosyltransferase-isomerase QueA [Deltaproteobacteria bacterium RIFCSPLOWO2_12_FULL_57_22]
MELKEFMYELPQSLIAAYPTRDRAAARLLVVELGSGELRHLSFSDLGNFLQPGDVLVLNDTRVFPARLRGRKESGGKAEVLLLEPFDERRSLWMALVEAANSPRVGGRIFFADGFFAEVVGDLGKGQYGLRFHYQGDFMEWLETQGEPPLPQYIQRTRAVASTDWERYQTVYASHRGAVAAPTAGFHFTQQLLEELASRGVERAFLTLHVGPGTFQPVRDEVVEHHRMAGERYKLEAEEAEKIERAKRMGKRVIAVGSTTTRTLEWIALRKGRIEADEGIARLFIHPGYAFRVIDGLLTNFHLPGSTPLILVSAFAGLDLVRRAYREAIRLNYRFYSYGDAMLIL